MLSRTSRSASSSTRPGYRFESDERARVYLTNALEPPGDGQLTLDFLPALAQEAAAVNEVKRRQRFTVVIGNPPYSNFGQLNRIPFILALIHDYKRDLREKKINLDDDFIKFVRFSAWTLNAAGTGIHGMITNNVYLDGLTHRQMRRNLLESFPLIRILNLHGSLKKKEKAPNGAVDENVFDITVGVAIAVLVHTPRTEESQVSYCDLWGSLGSKMQHLVEGPRSLTWIHLTPARDRFLLIPQDATTNREYQSWWSIRDLFLVWQNGLKTDRDELFFDLSRRPSASGCGSSSRQPWIRTSGKGFGLLHRRAMTSKRVVCRQTTQIETSGDACTGRWICDGSTMIRR